MRRPRRGVSRRRSNSSSAAAAAKIGSHRFYSRYVRPAESVEPASSASERTSGCRLARFVGFKDGRHGTEIFGPHPELPRQIVAWFVDTLIKSPADPTARIGRRKSAIAEFWAAASARGGAADAARLFRESRTRDPGAFLFPQFILNQLAYSRLQEGDAGEAVQLFQLNVEAYPTSANAQDSLADGYAANGRNDLALAAEQKCLDLLPADTINADFKAALRQAAEEKIAKLKGKRQGASQPGSQPTIAVSVIGCVWSTRTPPEPTNCAPEIRIVAR